MDYLNFLDTIKLPFELPLLLHPISVHFLIAIPIVILLLELVNLALKRPYMNKITASFWFLLIFIFVFAFFAGKTDGSHALSMLSDDGQKELKFHKIFGIYLVYASIIPFIAKLSSMLIKKRAAQIIYFIILLSFIGTIFKQGYDGAELVYKYGANVKMVSNQNDEINDMKNKINELKEKIDNCENKLKESQSQNPTQTNVPQEENNISVPSTINEQNNSEENLTETNSSQE